MKLFFTCHSGAEKTRDELRKQVYDAMAEEEKSGAVNTKPESQAGKDNTEVKEENGVVKSPVKPDVTGSEEPSSDKSPAQKAEVNGAASVNGVGQSPAGAPGKETVIKMVDSKEQNGKETSSKPEEGKDEESKPEAEQDNEEPEGSDLWIQSTVCVEGGAQAWYFLI